MLQLKVKGENKRFALLRPVDEKSDSVRFAASTSNNVTDIYLYDVIGFPFIEAQDLLYEIPHNATEINVYINSPGGDIFQGIAIYNQLKNHQAKVNVIIDSQAASIASIIAMAGDTITMRPGAFIMIHNGWSRISADAEGLRAEANLLDKIKLEMAAIYATRSNKKPEDFIEPMNLETWFSGKEAVDFGLADRVDDVKINGSIQAARFDMSVFNNAPETLRVAISHNNKLEDNTMKISKELFALLVALGMPDDSTNEQALAYLADVDVDKVIDQKERAAVVKALDEMTKDTIPASDKSAFTLEDVASASKAAVKNERIRCAEIRKAVKIAGQPDDMAKKFIDDDTAIDEVRKALFEKMKETNPPVGAGAIVMTADERDKFRSAVSHGIFLHLLYESVTADFKLGSKLFNCAKFKLPADRICESKYGCV